MIMNKTGKTLPLFLHVTEPLAVIVINDEIFVREACLIHSLNIERALELLFQLYSDETGREGIFKEMYNHFTNPVLAKMIPQGPALTGLTGYYEGYDAAPDYLCLDVEMVIKEKQSKPILLTNVTYNSILLEQEITISATEGFLILSNLFVQKNLDNFIKQSALSKDIIFSNKVLDSLQVFRSRYLLPLYRYSASFIEIVSKQIMDGSLSPETVLQYGGIASLILLTGLKPVKEFVQEISEKLLNKGKKLSKIEKIQFFSLAYCLWFYAKIRYLDIEEFPNLERFFSSEELVKETLAEINPKFISNMTDYLIECISLHKREKKQKRRKRRV